MQQTDVRQKHRLMPPTIRSGGTISRMNNEKLMYGRALTGDVEKSVLKFDESRRPVVVVDATRDDALCVERSPADEERHSHRHCVKHTQHTHKHSHMHALESSRIFENLDHVTVTCLRVKLLPPHPDVALIEQQFVELQQSFRSTTQASAGLIVCYVFRELVIC